jgi:hypothetical protein
MASWRDGEEGLVGGHQLAQDGHARGAVGPGLGRAAGVLQHHGAVHQPVAVIDVQAVVALVVLDLGEVELMQGVGGLVQLGLGQGQIDLGDADLVVRALEGALEDADGVQEVGAGGGGVMGRQLDLAALRQGVGQDGIVGVEDGLEDVDRAADVGASLRQAACRHLILRHGVVGLADDAMTLAAVAPVDRHCTQERSPGVVVAAHLGQNQSAVDIDTSEGLRLEIWNAPVEGQRRSKAAIGFRYLDRSPLNPTTGLSGQSANFGVLSWVRAQQSFGLIDGALRWDQIPPVKIGQSQCYHSACPVSAGATGQRSRRFQRSARFLE